MEWFKHDIGAFRDEKIQALRIDCGGAAVDAYYAIIELIYENEADLTLGKNQAETKSVLHGLCLGWAGFLEYVKSMDCNGLLRVKYHRESDDDNAIDSVTLKSQRASDVIADMNRLAKVARQNGKNGGRPKKKNPKETQEKPSDNPEQTQSKPRAPKTNKTIKTNKNDLAKAKSQKDAPEEHAESIERIVAYLNAKAGTAFKATSKDTCARIRARLADGFTEADFLAVIDGRCAAWRNNPRMAEYLRPKTLFAPSNFEGYLQAAKGVRPNAVAEKYRAYEQRSEG